MWKEKVLPHGKKNSIKFGRGTRNIAGREVWTIGKKGKKTDLRRPAGSGIVPRGDPNGEHGKKRTVQISRNTMALKSVFFAKKRG